jgi:hypothetical protein
MTAHNQWLPTTRSIPYWTTSVFSSAVTNAEQRINAHTLNSLTNESITALTSRQPEYRSPSQTVPLLFSRCHCNVCINIRCHGNLCLGDLLPSNGCPTVDCVTSRICLLKRCLAKVYSVTIFSVFLYNLIKLIISWPLIRWVPWYLQMSGSE